MVPKRLREARIASGLSQEKLAELVGIDGLSTRSRLSNYEVGRFTPPFDLILRIAKILNYPEYYFYIIDDDVAKMLLDHYRSSGDFELQTIPKEYIDRDSKRLKSSLEDALIMSERLTAHIKKSLK